MDNFQQIIDMPSPSRDPWKETPSGLQNVDFAKPITSKVPSQENANNSGRTLLQTASGAITVIIIALIFTFINIG